MPRIRTIKPEQAKDEDLSKLSIWARHLFTMLPCHADRLGRMQDRPQYLKIEIYPWDDIDMDALLDELAPKFIVRYEADGRRYIQIRTFLDHQIPNNREGASEIPEPSKDDLNGAFIQKKGKKGALNKIERNGNGNGKGTGMDIAPKGAKVKPSPKVDTPVQSVVQAYKMSKGVPRDDTAWDRQNFGRYSKAARSLLGVFGGDPAKAAAYIFLREQDLDAAGLEWTLETIARHAYDGVGLPKPGGQNGAEHVKVDRGQPQHHGRIGRTSQAGDLAGHALRELAAPLPAEGDGDLAGPEGDSLHDVF